MRKPNIVAPLSLMYYLTRGTRFRWAEREPDGTYAVYSLGMKQIERAQARVDAGEAQRDVAVKARAEYGRFSLTTVKKLVDEGFLKVLEIDDEGRPLRLGVPYKDFAPK